MTCFQRCFSVHVGSRGRHHSIEHASFASGDCYGDDANNRVDGDDGDDGNDDHDDDDHYDYNDDDVTSPLTKPSACP